MITFLKIFLGCKGTWFWACRKMMEGKTVYRLRDSGTVRFSYDVGIRKIKAMISWPSYEEKPDMKQKEWGISMEDVFATDFMVLTEHTNFNVLNHQSQMKCDTKPLKKKQFKKHLKPWGGEPLNTSKNARS